MAVLGLVETNQQLLLDVHLAEISLGLPEDEVPRTQKLVGHAVLQDTNLIFQQHRKSGHEGLWKLL